MTESGFGDLLSTLTASKVEFVLIGGLAAMAHGSARATVDVDVVYCRSPENVRRLADCLAPFEPYLRGLPAGLPFVWDYQTIEQGLNFTLRTQIGDIDLLGEVPGDANFESLSQASEEMVLFGVKMKCVKLEMLIHLKRAAGRPKDIEAIAELEAILEDRSR